MESIFQEYLRTMSNCAYARVEIGNTIVTFYFHSDGEDYEFCIVFLLNNSRLIFQKKFSFRDIDVIKIILRC